MPSFEWFLTVPGILISCGVILLVIVLIMFIISGSKKKPVDVSMPQMNENASLEKTVETVIPVDSVDAVDQVIPNSVDLNIETEEVNNVVAEDLNNAVNEEVKPVESDVVVETPVVDVNNNVQEPVTQTSTVLETASNNEENKFVVDLDNTLPLPGAVSEEVVVPSFEGDNVMPTDAVEVGDDSANTFVPKYEEPVVEEVKVEEPSFEIPDPIPTPQEEVKPFDLGNINIEPEEPKPIYGGANPLDATQNLPKVDVHREPYSGGLKETEVKVEDVSPKTESKFITVPDETDVTEIGNSEPALEQQEEPKLETTQIITLPGDKVEEL